MRCTMCYKVLYVYIKDEHDFACFLVHEICTDSDTLTLMQTAYDITGCNRFGGPQGRSDLLLDLIFLYHDSNI